MPLPHQLYLLSHQPAKGRLDDDSDAVRGSLLCGAAVAELCLGGWLRDRGGKAERTAKTVPANLDPFLAGVLGDVPPDRPRRWFDLLEQRWVTAPEAVQDGLVAAGVITVGHHQIVGPFRTKRIALTDPEPAQALRDRVRQAARRAAGSVPPPIEEAVLAVLAIEGNVSTVFGWRDLWRHKLAVRELKNRVDHELPGLRSALIPSIALRRAG
uniref:GOLPH3/VPS74 family protein n=1 Tax=Paractinoplanes polyasparticus TaxID=2856853 RepID=UPI001C854E1F|nr:GPP34 family phosphoprotein [Actinoplanes polyasparticus]